MPGGRINTYNMPIIVYCFGQSQAVRDVVAKRVALAGHRFGGSDNLGAAGGLGGGAGGNVGVTLAPAHMESALDRLFEGKPPLPSLLALSLKHSRMLPDPYLVFINCEYSLVIQMW